LVGYEKIPELVELHELMHHWYRELTAVQRDAFSGLKPFTKVVKNIRSSGKKVVPTAAAGIYKLSQEAGCTYDQSFLDRWLDGFLLSRIGSNMLCDQYRAVADPEDGGLGRSTGIIDLNCDAVAVTTEAVELASRICHHVTGRSPECVIESFRAGKKKAFADLYI